MKKAIVSLAAAASLFGATTAHANLIIPSVATDAVASMINANTGATTTYIFRTQWSLDVTTGKVDL